MVIYLSDYGVGGPTLVTTQTCTSTQLASEGLMIFPKSQRVVAFAGNVLHGVIPGYGSDFSPPRNASGSIVKFPRRVTWMVAFWKNVSIRAFNPQQPCACQKVPTPYESSHKWVKQLYHSSGLCSAHPVDINILRPVKMVSPIPVSPVLVDVPDHISTIQYLKFLPSYDKIFQGF